MATQNQTLQVSPYGATAWGVATAKLRESYDRWRVYRTTLSELTSLSGRELADLGLHRSELKRVAWQAAQNS